MIINFGGFCMRILILFSVSLALLFGCSNNNESQNETIGNESEEVTNSGNSADESRELTQEEKLVEELPEASNLEDWNLILVGPQYALPDAFEPRLVEVDNEQFVDERIEEAWYSWKEAALQAGHRLFFASGYRSIEHQRANFNNTYENYLNEGYSEAEALDRTKDYLTEPGHSEHHTGLALDIVDEEWIVAGNGLIPEYDTQASQQWMMDTMADYGFILRYPAKKEDITDIQYESWHFRYVGEENAQYIVANDLVLEEYIELLELREELQ